MQLFNTYNKGYQLAIILETLDFVTLNTITNTVIIKKGKISENQGSNFDTSITIKKEIPLQLNVNNKK